METINLTGQDCPLQSKECIERIIAGYLCDTKYIIRNLYCLGSKVRLELDYDDFLPEAKVREYLEDNIPNLELTLNRDLSENAITDAMNYMYKDLIEVWCYDHCNRSVNISLHSVVDAWLSDKEIHHGTVLHGRRTPAK